MNVCPARDTYTNEIRMLFVREKSDVWATELAVTSRQGGEWTKTIAIASDCIANKNVGPCREGRLRPERISTSSTAPLHSSIFIFL
jgi:hypothetical protein